MAYVAVSNTNLETDDPVRSVDITQMNDNIIDHESRINNLEDPGSKLFSHFVSNPSYASQIIAQGGATVALASRADFEGQFYVAAETGDTSIQVRHNVNADRTSDGHYLILDGGTGGGGGACMVVGQAAYEFDNRVKPLTFRARCKIPTHVSAAMVIGFSELNIAGGSGHTAEWMAAARGVYLNIVDISNWRFTATDSSGSTSGSNINPIPTANTWFTVEIVFTDDPSNQAVCKVNDVTEATLNANLPTGDQLYGGVGWDPNQANRELFLDRMLVSAGGPVADSA